MPTSTIPPYFVRAGCPSCRPTNSVKALKATSAFGLGRRRWSYPQWCYLHRIRTLIGQLVWRYNRHGPKTGRLCPLGGSWGTCNTMWPGLRPTSISSGILINPAVCPQQTRVENWVLCPFWREAGSPSTTTSPGPTPTFVLSGIFIHPVVWPQYMGRKVGAAIPPF